MNTDKPKKTRNRKTIYETKLLIRITSEDALKLKEYAKKHNVTASTLIRNFIKTLD